MKVKIKKLHPDAVIPSYAKQGDAGLDLTAISKSFDGSNDVYGTGLAVEIPENFVGLIFPRSSLSKKDQFLTNHVGVIDSGYRGEILFKFKNLTQYIHPSHIVNFKSLGEYEIGDRIGQLIIIPYPKIEFEEADELTETERGVDGYGSTDKSEPTLEDIASILPINI